MVKKRVANLVVEFILEGTEINSKIDKTDYSVSAQKCLKIRPEEFFEKFEEYMGKLWKIPGVRKEVIKEEEGILQILRASFPIIWNPRIQLLESDGPELQARPENQEQMDLEDSDIQWRRKRKKKH